MRRVAMTAAMAAALVIGCGGTLESRAPVATPSATATPTEAPTAAPTAAASLVAGSIGYRIVNQTNAPIDVYVRSQGIVRASLAKAALGPVEVTDELFPPEPGEIVVLPAGAGDPTCVISCDFAAEATSNTGEGKHRILVVRGADSTEYWADPKPASVGTAGNALRPADATRPLVIIEAGGVADGKFGLRVSWGPGGCVEALDAAGLMLGGTNVLAYAIDPAGGALRLFAGSDTTCSGASVAGPFAVAAAAAGSRMFVIAWGGTGAVKAVVLPLP
jgi:hypothetical protein